MGLKYLWDTNAVIYYLQKSFTEDGQELMNGIINSHQPAISSITEIELLSWRTANDNDISILNSFFQTA
ncbi:MAG: type toxin-antitoxin system VapC family toxin [Mucilaginibacter sp.]|nr:type toxin-antitoxin system VapC family toxin [Mucilaginibacter sp.]